MCQAQVMLINKNVSLMKNGFVSFMKNGLKIEPDISHPLGKKKRSWLLSKSIFWPSVVMVRLTMIDYSWKFPILSGFF